MNSVKANVHRCATCSSWFGGTRFKKDGDMVMYDASPSNAAQCKHPLSGKTNQMVKPDYVCSKWTQAF